MRLHSTTLDNYGLLVPHSRDLNSSAGNWCGESKPRFNFTNGIKKVHHHKHKINNDFRFEYKIEIEHAPVGTRYSVDVDAMDKMAKRKTVLTQ